MTRKACDPLPMLDTLTRTEAGVDILWIPSDGVSSEE